MTINPKEAPEKAYPVAPVMPYSRRLALCQKAKPPKPTRKPVVAWVFVAYGVTHSNQPCIYTSRSMARRFASGWRSAGWKVRGPVKVVL